MAREWSSLRNPKYVAVLKIAKYYGDHDDI
jgi:hypothetical protein